MNKHDDVNAKVNGNFVSKNLITFDMEKIINANLEISSGITRVMESARLYNLSILQANLNAITEIVNPLSTIYEQSFGRALANIVDQIRLSLNANLSKSIESLSYSTLHIREALEKFHDLSFEDFHNIDFEKMTNEIEIPEQIDNEETINQGTTINIENVNYYMKSAMESEHDGKSFLKKFVIDVMKDYGVAAAKKVIALLVISLIIFTTKNHDVQISYQVQDEIKYEFDSRKIKKVFLKNKDIGQPINSMGYTRVSSFLRSGPNKKTPVIDTEKISMNQTVIILERNGNWVKVYYENDASAGSGWIEESKVIKFKLK